MFSFFKLKPFNEGFLPEVDGHQVYFREFGNPKGLPVLSTHGGPGGYTKSKRAKLFCLKKYRVIMFDQRGCGRSIPSGELKYNNTQKTLEDMTRLLDYLKVEQKVILQGSSWSSTLMLLFAEKNPNRVEKIIINSVFLARREDLDWDIEGSRIFYPDIYDEVYKKAKSAKEYYKMITSNNVEKQRLALKYFCGYEYVLGTTKPILPEADFRFLNSAKVYLHYLVNNLFIKENQILKDIKKIKEIPILIVHNRLDFVCPVKQAYDLSKKMNNTKLEIVADKGHYSTNLSKTVARQIKNFLF